jgi:hypothetical protein
VRQLILSPFYWIIRCLVKKLPREFLLIDGHVGQFFGPTDPG